jgi:hypothetical protein
MTTLAARPCVGRFSPEDAVGAAAQMNDESRAVLEHDVVAGWQGLLAGEELVVQLGIVTAKARK